MDDRIPAHCTASDALVGISDATEQQVGRFFGFFLTWNAPSCTLIDTAGRLVYYALIYWELPAKSDIAQQHLIQGVKIENLNDVILLSTFR